MSSPHPLDPASAEEYLAGRDILVAAGLLAEPVRFAYYGLEEAAKDEVLAGAVPDRQAPCVPGQHRHRRVHRRGGLAHPRQGRQRAHPGPGPGRPAAHPGERLRPGRRDHQGRPGVARGHGQARLPRPEQDPDLPDHRGRVRAARRRPAADGPGAGVRPGPRARPGLGAPDRRRSRLRGPDREEGLQGHRRVRAPGARGSPATTTTRPSAARTGPRSSRSRSPSRRDRASPWTGTRCAGRTGRCGSASTPARD